MLRRLFSSLRVRVLSLVLLAVLPALGLMWVGGLVVRGAATREVRADVLRLTRLAASGHEALLEGAYQLLAGLAQLPEVRTLDAAGCSARMADVANQFPAYINLGATDAHGDLFCSAVPPAGPVNLSDRSYFQRAVASRGMAVGDYQVGRATGRPSLNFAHAVIDDSGQVRGVVFAAVDLSWFQRLGGAVELPEGSTFLIVDSQGTVLSRVPDPEAWVGGPVPDPPLAAVIQAQSDGIAQIVGLDGVARLYAFTSLGGPTESGLRLAIGIPQATAYAGADRVVAWSLASMGIASVLALATVWWAGDAFVLSRVRALLRATRRLGEGHLSVRTGLPHDDGEIGQLARAFDGMAEALERRDGQLRQAEARYRALVEQTPTVTYSAALHGARDCLYVSPQIEAMLGFSPAEWLARPGLWQEQLHPADRERVQSELERVRVSGEPLRAEYRMLARDGRAVWVRNDALVLRDEAGRPFVQGVMHDITERRLAEEALRRSEQRLALHVQHTPLGAIEWDTEFRVVRWNPAAERIFGVTRAEALGRHAADLIVPPGARADVDRVWSDPIRGQGGERGTNESLTRDGRLILCEWYNTPLVDDAGTVVGIASLVQDVTVRREAEARIQRQLEHLSALRAIDVAITASLDLRLTLNVLLDQVMSQLKVDAALALTFNPVAQELAYAAARGFRGSAITSARLRLGEGIAGRAALERRALCRSDLPEGEEHLRHSPRLAGEGFEDFCSVPLVAKGQVAGVLEIFHRTPLARGPEWMDFLETLAGQAAIAIDNASLFEGLQRSHAELSLAYDRTLEGWTCALDLRDEETEGHTQRVTATTVRLARAMGLPEAELVHVRRGALLHDIGKMGIPDSILRKPGPLTEAEWAVMRRHPTYAYELLSPIEYLRPALDIPYCHHERWDGTGYPRGLRGEQIPRAARLFAVVDVWDALRSDRPYRKAWPEDRVLEYIRSLAGTHFDPAVADAFLALVGSG